MGVLGALAGCASAVAQPATKSAVVAPVLLDRHPELLVEMALPDASRAAPPALIPVPGPWRVTATVHGVRTWETPLPVRLRTLFFSTPPDDLDVSADHGERSLSHSRLLKDMDREGTWEFGPTSLRVRRDAALGPPDPGEIRVQYSRAVARERGLNKKLSGLDDAEFLFRSLQVRDTTRRGLLVPAPGIVTFKVEVPEGGALEWSAGLVPPEAGDLAPSDGASLRVAVLTDGGERTVETQKLDVGSFEKRRISLEEWEGQTVNLRFKTDPDGDNRADYAFIVEPTVLVPQADPPRVVLIFVDTLRADHLSLYGYPRKTTPNIDAWAERAAVFEQARSIAPWTLPSARTMVSGVPPELWMSVDSLQARFAKAGWATSFFAGNTYLSSNFGIERDWGLHRCLNWPRAEVEIDRALNFLADNKDKPVFMLVHLMDQHLPYREPQTWRYRFAGSRPDLLDSDWFKRGDVQRVAAKLGEEGKQYLRDRYDNNLAYSDDQISRLLAKLDTTSRDTVLILADHGEEFWDHGGFEHGHTLYDELIHVPFVLAGPGVSAGRFTEPVSMLDVAPTLASAAGLPLDGFAGAPVQAVADRSRAAEFESRPQAFGRPLYGEQQWGALSGTTKWIVHEGEEQRFDVAADPVEKSPATPDALDREAMRAAMLRALGVPVELAWRIAPRARGGYTSMEAVLDVPGGVAQAWVGEDPTEQSSATVEVEGERVRMRWKAGNTRTIEVFVLPTAGAIAALPFATLSIVGVHDDLVGEAGWPEDLPPALPQGDGADLITARMGSRAVSLRYMITPLPYTDAAALHGFDAEVAGELKALGYLGD